MTCGPSPRPMLSNPMADTRQLRRETPRAVSPSCRPIGIVVFVEQVVLLIERQQTADQQIVGLILSRSRQVQHPEILAIAIVVEMPIGIIHEDGFPIFDSQFLLRLPTRRANGLRERGAVFQ